jgi:hypothetical protein
MASQKLLPPLEHYTNEEQVGLTTLKYGDDVEGECSKNIPARRPHRADRTTTKDRSMRNAPANGKSHEILVSTQTPPAKNHQPPLPALEPIGRYARECMEATFRDSPLPSASNNDGGLRIPYTIFFDSERKGTYTAEFKSWEDIHLYRFLKGRLPMKYFGQGSILGFIPEDAEDETLRMFHSALEFEREVCYFSFFDGMVTHITIVMELDGVEVEEATWA